MTLEEIIKMQKALLEEKKEEIKIEEKPKKAKKKAKGKKITAKDKLNDVVFRFINLILEKVENKEINQEKVLELFFGGEVEKAIRYILNSSLSERDAEEILNQLKKELEE